MSPRRLQSSKEDQIGAKWLVGRKLHGNYQEKSTEFLGVQRQMGGISTEKKNKILWREKGTIVSVATIIMLHCTRCYHIHSHWVLRRTL